MTKSILISLVIILSFPIVAFPFDAARIEGDLKVNGINFGDSSTLYSSNDLLRNRGAWSSSSLYSTGDVVQHNGSSYVCTTTHTNITPPDQSYWSILANQGIKGDAGTSPWGLTGNDAYYTAGKVGIGTSTPASQLEVKGDIVRTINRVYGTSNQTVTLSNVWTDVPGRVIAYTKKSADTALRITYTDNRRFSVSSGASLFQYELVIDATSCPSGPLITYVENSSAINLTDGATQTKTCFGISTATMHVISLRVKSTNTNSPSAIFSYNNSYWAIEVEEVR